jgi:hypothetical protein
MKVDLRDIPRIGIESENETELNLISTDLIHSKLAFKLINGVNPDIRIELGSNFQIDLEARTIVLPHTSYGRSELNYFLRVALDSVAVVNGVLPLHGGAVYSKDQSLFLFGFSKDGKSTMVKALGDRTGYAPIGDDHLLVGKDRVVGNSQLRIRLADDLTEKFEPVETTERALRDYSILWVQLSSQDNYTRHTVSEFLGREERVNEVLKYILKPVTVNGCLYTIDDLTGVDIEARGRELFKRFIGQSRQINTIQGNIHQILRRTMEQK